jgi:hypothetical protein
VTTPAPTPASGGATSTTNPVPTFSNLTLTDVAIAYVADYLWVIAPVLGGIAVVVVAVIVIIAAVIIVRKRKLKKRVIAN